MFSLTDSKLSIHPLDQRQLDVAVRVQEPGGIEDVRLGEGDRVGQDGEEVVGNNGTLGNVVATQLGVSERAMWNSFGEQNKTYILRYIDDILLI